MVVILKKNPEEKQLNNLINWLKSMNMEIQIFEGMSQTILGLIGNTDNLEIDLIKTLDIVEDVRRIQEPYKNANREFHPDDSVVQVGDCKIGGGNFAIIAGPCSVESELQLNEVAQRVKDSGAQMLRGGAFKPRTSPYSFQGLKGEGLDLLLKAKELTGLPIITELMDLGDLPLFDEVDVIQIGARNMQNFSMLKELGRQNKPVLIKRGLSSTLEELLMSAEYVMAGGNKNVILCERGIRTFETMMRNTLDLSAVPMLKTLSHLPVVVDPSHAIGIARYVKPLALAATAVGADALMIEVHNNPRYALCDGAQSLTPEEFDDVANCVRTMRKHSFTGEGLWK